MSPRTGASLRHLATILFVVGALASALSGCLGPDGGTPGGDGTGTGEGAGNATVALESFEGRLVCGLAASGSGSNPCAAVPGSRNVFRTTVPRGTETLLVGLAWEPSTGSSEALQLNVESEDYTNVGGNGVRFASEAGRPDVVIRLEANQLEEMTGHDLEKASMGILLRVFPGHDGVVVDQPFDIHLAAHVGARAPDDASPFVTA